MKLVALIIFLVTLAILNQVVAERQRVHERIAMHIETTRHAAYP